MLLFDEKKRFSFLINQLFFIQARHRSDTEVNNREVKNFVGKELITKKWKDIKVGAIVQLTNSEFVTVRKYSVRPRIFEWLEIGCFGKRLYREK